MKKGKGIQIEILVVEITVFFIILTLLLSVFTPIITQITDDYRFSRDERYAETMSDILALHAPETFTTPLDGHEVRAVIEAHSTEAVDFTPQAAETGFFYDAREHRIIALRYHDAIDYNDITQRTFPTPAELFGDGLLLLTTDGSFVTDAVWHLYTRAAHRRSLSETYPYTLETWQMSLTTSLTSRFLSLETSNVKTVVAEMLNHYDYETTLFVNNDAWSTDATRGENIEKIVFLPGIRTIPTFSGYRFERGSIELDTVTLPATVRTIKQNAFSNQFAIDSLEIKGGRHVQTETGALNGVNHVGWVVEEYDKDDIDYHINVVFEGKPLITYDPDVVRATNSFDLSRLYAYFDVIDETIVGINIELKLLNLQNSRVYVYTEDGYYGYVIPELE